MELDYEESGDGFLASVRYQEQKTITTPKTTPKTREQLLDLIRQNNQVTREELAHSLGISVNGVKQHILKLKKDGLVTRVGGHRFGVWQLISDT